MYSSKVQICFVLWQEVHDDLCKAEFQPIKHLYVSLCCGPLICAGTRLRMSKPTSKNCPRDQSTTSRFRYDYAKVFYKFCSFSACLATRSVQAADNHCMSHADVYDRSRVNKLSATISTSALRLVSCGDINSKRRRVVNWRHSRLECTLRSHRINAATTPSKVRCQSFVGRHQRCCITCSSLKCSISPAMHKQPRRQGIEHLEEESICELGLFKRRCKLDDVVSMTPPFELLAAAAYPEIQKAKTITLSCKQLALIQVIGFFPCAYNLVSLGGLPGAAFQTTTSRNYWVPPVLQTLLLWKCPSECPHNFMAYPFSHFRA